MKIRSSYVSNSSSSSFIIVGYEVGDIFDEPKTELDFKHDYYIYLGKEGFDDEIDVIDLNQEKYDWLYDHKWNIKDIGRGTIIKVIDLQEDDCMKLPNNIKDIENVLIWSLKINHHSSKTIKDLEERYIQK